MNDNEFSISQREIEAIRSMQRKIGGLNKQVGWWDNPVEVGTRLMLIVTEIAEATEGARKDLQDDHLPHRKMFEVELADAVIRILDLAAFYNLELAEAIAEKHDYNAKREDHKLENRMKAGGKAF